MPSTSRPVPFTMTNGDVTGVSGPRLESGRTDSRRMSVILRTILKRIIDGIVATDPCPQYSALDRLDGLCGAFPERPAKDLHEPGR